ncbi:MAG: hypothetical protein Q7K21_03780, partial [Elusimicrobiota bacterium]|nr:hypothetical protein [Elusimicrobiota bacterium]
MEISKLREIAPQSGLPSVASASPRNDILAITFSRAEFIPHIYYAGLCIYNFNFFTSSILGSIKTGT